MSQKLIEIDWDQLSSFAETCEAILYLDQTGIAGLYAFLDSIEKQHPEMKALTKVREEIRASTATVSNSLRIRYTEP